MSPDRPMPEGFTPPLQRALAIKMAVTDDGGGVAWVDVDPELHYGTTAAHGGLAATLVDIAGGIAVARALGRDWRRLGATVELKVNFLRRVVTGDMSARAQILHLGRRLAVTDVQVTNGDRLCAKGLVTYMLERPDDSGAAGRS